MPGWLAGCVLFGMLRFAKQEQTRLRLDQTSFCNELDWTALDLTGTMVDLHRTMVDLPNTMVDIPTGMSGKRLYHLYL